MSCTPQSLFSGRIGLRVEFCEGRIECGAEEVGLSLRQAIEALPEEIEIGARRRVHALRPTKAQPNLFEPCAEGRGRSRGMQALGERDGAQHALHGWHGRRQISSVIRSASRSGTGRD